MRIARDGLDGNGLQNGFMKTVQDERFSNIHPLTIHYHFDSEDDYRSSCRNVSHCHQSSFQNYTHPDDHTRQITDTPGFKPFTIQVWIGNL